MIERKLNNPIHMKKSTKIMREAMRWKCGIYINEYVNIDLYNYTFTNLRNLQINYYSIYFIHSGQRLKFSMLKILYNIYYYMQLMHLFLH